MIETALHDSLGDYRMGRYGLIRFEEHIELVSGVKSYRERIEQLWLGW
jgi:hypothetical protein